MKKRMNKIITLGISLSMLALSACGNAGTDASSKAVTEDSSVSAEASVEVAEATKPEELGSGDVKWTDTNNRSRSASSDTIRVPIFERLSTFLCNFVSQSQVKKVDDLF